MGGSLVPYTRGDHTTSAGISVTRSSTYVAALVVVHVFGFQRCLDVVVD